MTHTHKGTCQICGRTQAVNNKTGRIAKHGYTVDFGFFSGTCEGSDELPLQQDRAFLDKHIALWKTHADRIYELTIFDIEAVPVTVYEGYTRRTVWMERDEYEQNHDSVHHTFSAAAERHLEQKYRSAEFLLDHAEQMKASADEIFGTELFAVVKSERQTKKFDSYKQARAFANTLKEQGIKTQVRRTQSYGEAHSVFWTPAP